MHSDVSGVPVVRPGWPTGGPSGAAPSGAAGPSAGTVSSYGTGGGTPTGRPVGDRLRQAALLAAPAIGIYLLLRVLSLGVTVVFALLAKSRGVANFTFYDGSTNSWRGWETPVDLLLLFDGRWYTFLAAEGYGQSGMIDDTGVPHNFRVVFFPLYPWLIRLVAGLTGAPITAAALVVSTLASIAAAWALFAIGNHMRDRHFGVLLAALWALVPAGVVEQAAFTESLFVALAGWALYAVLTRRWLAAGSLAAIAGLTRPTAVALVGTVGLAALVAIVGRQDGWRPYVAALLSPVGYFGHLWYAGTRLGGVGEYFKLQHDWWASYYDFGVSTAADLYKILLGDPQWIQPAHIIAALTVLLVVPLYILAWQHGTHWVLLVFAAAMLIGVLGSHQHFSMIPRHILPAFPLLVAPAVGLAAGLAAGRTRTIVVVLVFLGLLSGWYGGWVPLSSGMTV